MLGYSLRHNRDQVLGSGCKLLPMHKPVHCRQGRRPGFSASALLAFWDGQHCCGGLSCVHCKMFSNISGLHPLDVSSTFPKVMTIKMSPDIANVPRGGGVCVAKFIPSCCHVPIPNKVIRRSSIHTSHSILTRLKPGR